MIHKKNLLFLLPIITTLIIFFIIYHPWLSHFNIPISYSGDNLWNIVSIKNIIENKNSLITDKLGYPFKYIMNDFPTSDWSFLLQIYLLSIIVKDHFLLTNIFYLISYLLISITSFYVFYKKTKSIFLSLTGQIIFTFSSYHLIRGEDHLFLAAYFCIPLTFFIIFKILKQKKICIKTLIFLSLIIGSSGIYYAFFSVILIFFSYLISIFNSPKPKNLNTYLIAPIIIIITVFLSITPSLLYSIKNGKNEIVGLRHPAESEYYGLRITQLLIPLNNHRLPFLINLQTKYNNQGLEPRGEKTEYLGIFGIFGFMISMFSAFFLTNSKKHKLLYKLSVVNIFILLFATTGGFGTTFAYFVSPQIRCYNRISPFILFICIFSLLYFIKYQLQKIKNKILKLFIYLTIIILTIVTVQDQVPPLVRNKNSFTALYEEFINDQLFIKEIEKSLPQQANILQLPYKDFPETLPIHKLGDYDLFKGFVQSQKIKWSYATIKGRYSGRVMEKISAYSTQKLLETLCLLDFDGIYIDRFGYVDNGQQLEKDISSLITSKPTVSSNQRLVFFNIQNFKKKFLSQYQPTEITNLKKQILSHPIYEWKEGCYELEATNQPHRWCSRQSKLNIYNPFEKKTQMSLRFIANSGYPKVSDLFIKINKYTDKVDINNQGAKYNKTITINPGINTLSFKTNAPQVITIDDPRKLYIDFIEFEIELKDPF